MYEIDTVALDPKTIPSGSESDSDRESAIFELMEHGKISFGTVTGPYDLIVSKQQKTLKIEYGGDDGYGTCRIDLPPFRTLIREYRQNLQDFDNVTDSDDIEQLDTFRQYLHNDAAEKIIEMLAKDSISTDQRTARGIWSLVFHCV